MPSGLAESTRVDYYSSSLMSTTFVYGLVAIVVFGTILRYSMKKSRLSEPQLVINAVIGLLLLVPALLASVQLGAEPGRPAQDGHLFILVDEDVNDVPLCVQVTTFPDQPDQLMVQVRSIPGTGASFVRELPAETSCADFATDSRKELAGKIHLFVTGPAMHVGKSNVAWTKGVAEDARVEHVTISDEGSILWRTGLSMYNSRNGRTVVRPPSVSVNEYYANSSVNFDVCPDTGAYCVKSIDSSVVELGIGSPGIDDTVDKSLPNIERKPSSLDSTDGLVWTSKRMVPVINSADKELDGVLQAAGGTIASPEVKLVNQTKVDSLNRWRNVLIALYGIGISITTGAVMSIVGRVAKSKSTSTSGDLQL